jgi:hypothetical protein
VKFIRWGNLNPVKQEGYRCQTFHSPPARWGIYAFPVGFVEKFLLGGFDFREDKFEWVRDKEGNLIGEGHPLFEKLCWKENHFYLEKSHLTPYKQFIKKRNQHRPYNPKYMAKLKSPKKFTHYGNIWTHFVPLTHSYIKKNKDWYLVSHDIFLDLLQKRDNFALETKIKNGLNIVKDDCEVFIEKIQHRKITLHDYKI